MKIILSKQFVNAKLAQAMPQTVAPQSAVPAPVSGGEVMAPSDGAKKQKQMTNLQQVYHALGQHGRVKAPDIHPEKVKKILSIMAPQFTPAVLRQMFMQGRGNVTNGGWEDPNKANSQFSRKLKKAPMYKQFLQQSMNRVTDFLQQDANKDYYGLQAATNGVVTRPQLEVILANLRPRAAGLVSKLLDTNRYFQAINQAPVKQQRGTGKKQRQMQAKRLNTLYKQVMQKFQRGQASQQDVNMAKQAWKAQTAFNASQVQKTKGINKQNKGVQQNIGSGKDAHEQNVQFLSQNHPYHNMAPLYIPLNIASKNPQLQAAISSLIRSVNQKDANGNHIYNGNTRNIISTVLSPIAPHGTTGGGLNYDRVDPANLQKLQQISDKLQQDKQSGYRLLDDKTRKALKTERKGLFQSGGVDANVQYTSIKALQFIQRRISAFTEQFGSIYNNQQTINKKDTLSGKAMSDAMAVIEQIGSVIDSAGSPGISQSQASLHRRLGSQNFAKKVLTAPQIQFLTDKINTERAVRQDENGQQVDLRQPSDQVSYARIPEYQDGAKHIYRHDNQQRAIQGQDAINSLKHVQQMNDTGEITRHQGRHMKDKIRNDRQLQLARPQLVRPNPTPSVPPVVKQEMSQEQKQQRQFEQYLKTQKKASVIYSWKLIK